MDRHEWEMVKALAWSIEQFTSRESLDEVALDPSAEFKCMMMADAIIDAANAVLSNIKECKNVEVK